MKSILQKNERCYWCHEAVGTEWHHIFPGKPNRRHSEDDGLKVLLCWACHWKVHNDSQDSGRMMMKLKKDAQKAYEAAGHTREEFLKRYGHNYLGWDDE